jgi:hypothetical protein
MAITLPVMVPLGGGMVLYRGSYSHTAGAAVETFNLGSARVSSISLSNMDSGGKKEQVAFSESVSGSTNTVSVLANAGVTDGRIEVVAYAGN